MSEPSISLWMTVVQLENFSTKLRQQVKLQESLFVISCDMFKELYELKPTSPLLKRWHEIASQLIL